MSQSRAQEVLALKQQVEQAQKLRSDAEVARQVATQQLAMIDEECRALGVEPDNLEAEITTLDTQIGVLIEQTSASVAEETTAYKNVLTSARAAGVIK